MGRGYLKTCFMENTAMTCVVMVILLLASHHTDAHAGEVAEDTSAIVTAVMKDQYGNQYDARHECWVFTPPSEEGHSVTYCMRPGPSSVVDTVEGRRLYLYAANVYDIHDDKRYAYGHNEPGLMGVFKIKLDAKVGWIYVALDNAMAFGTNGYCGCNNARFVKLSNQGDYGWLFVSGGTWQGVTVADYSIVMAHNGRFVDVSNIPQVTEGEQNIKYELTPLDDYRGAGMVPLKIIKMKDDAKVAEFQIGFDPKTFTYSLSGSH